LIRIEELTFRYSGGEKPSLASISLEIGNGEFVLIAGPSGGGKSSLCRCLNGLIPHFYGGEIGGTVEVDGLDVLQHSTKELATKVGMVFQDPENQLVTMDVEREIAFGLENLSYSRALMAKRVEEALDAVGIADLRHRALSSLSGGQKQRVAIASVLALHPTVLVLDEPTSELDPKGAEEVLNVLERLNDELGITVVLVEHRLDRVVQHADRMILLDRGAIVADGNPRSVLSHSGVEEMGIGVPPVIQLVQSLRDKGVDPKYTPLTVKEGRAALVEVLQCRSPEERRAEGQRREVVGFPAPAGGGASEPLIGVKGLYHVYPSRFAALRNISLEIYPGEFVAIMGRNASGKTTLVKHFNGLLKPTKGDVRVHGVRTKDTTVAELAKNVGFVFQDPNDHLFADTVEEEVAFTLRNSGFEEGERRQVVDRMLQKFDLTPYRHQYPRALSGGEKQRVALASVLAAQPEVFVMDEPTRGMDHRLKTGLMSFLNEYRDGGRVVILVTQDVEMVARYVDRVILLSEGQVVVDGSRREALSEALLFSPQMNRLAQSLRGYGVPGDILTADEMAEVVM